MPAGVERFDDVQLLFLGNLCWHESSLCLRTYRLIALI